MKQFAACILFCWAIPGYCQLTTYKSFTIEQSEIIWQNVYDSSVSIIDAERILKSTPHIRNVAISDSSITADIDHMPIEYAKYGYKRMNIPIWIRDYDVSGRLQFDFKPAKYRVTVFDIYLNSNNNNPRFSIPGSMTNHALRGNRKEIRPAYATSDMLGIHHRNFFDYFKLKERAIKSTW